MITEKLHYSLLPHNTFGMDIRADRFIEYSSKEELRQILGDKEIFSKPYLHIGSGSNLLFLSDFQGTVLHSAIHGIEVLDETEKQWFVRVGAGEVWDDFVCFCVKNGYGGVENLSLIPGEVGASAVQNIGAYGVEAKNVIERVEAIEIETLQERTFDKEDCCFSYRGSVFKKEMKGKYVVTSVVYKLDKFPVYKLEYGNIRQELEKVREISLNAVRQAIVRIRESKLPDPKIEGNAGSFFMNPLIKRSLFQSLLKKYPDMPFYEADAGWVKIPAAWLIDRCGWKGKSLGKAAVHAKQPLVLVNKGGASGKDILQLAEAVLYSVKEKFGIEIYPEVNIIG